MIESLEDRRLLSTTSVLNDPTFYDLMDGSGQSWTASTSVPHTHVQVDVSTGLDPIVIAGSSAPPYHPKLTVKIEGSTVYEVEYAYEQYQPGDWEWYPYVFDEYISPYGSSNGSVFTLPHSGSSASIEVTTSDVSYDDADVAVAGPIHVNALTPDVSVSSSTGANGDPTASEGNPVDTGKFVFQRYGAPLDVPLTVNYQMSGTATPEDEVDPASYPTGYSSTRTPGPDYYGLTRDGTVTFAPGEVSKSVALTPRNDGFYEGDETAITTLKSGVHYFPAGANVATVTLMKRTLVLTHTDPAAPGATAANPLVIQGGVGTYLSLNVTEGGQRVDAQLAFAPTVPLAAGTYTITPSQLGSGHQKVDFSFAIPPTPLGPMSVLVTTPEDSTVPGITIFLDIK